MNSKFTFTGETKFHLGTTLRRIKAIKSFGDVSEGELGGWIEKESNLSEEGNAWVCGNAQVCGDARVSGDAQVYGNGWVCGGVWVSGDARVYGDAQVYGNAQVSGKIKLESGWCFARKEKDWNVTEVENDGVTLLIKDYKPATETEEEVDKMTLEEVCKLLGKTIKIVK